MITFPMWQEIIPFINDLSRDGESYIERIYKEIIVKGRRGVSPQYLRKCFFALEKLNIVTRYYVKHSKPYKLTSKGQEIAQAINTLKKLVKDNV